MQSKVQARKLVSHALFSLYIIYIVEDQATTKETALQP